MKVVLLVKFHREGLNTLLNGCVPEGYCSGLMVALINIV